MSADFDFSGGARCLDFANTLPDRPRGLREGLRSYADLVEWARQAHVRTPGAARALRAEADRRPDAARAALERARSLREALYRIFSSEAAGRRSRPDDLDRLNRELPGAFAKPSLRSGPEGYGWHFEVGGSELSGILRDVVRSAAALLTSEDRPLVRECASETCSWLFLDRSRTRRRRWCDMKTCGNRAKARRHYRKKRRGSVRVSRTRRRVRGGSGAGERS